MDGGSGPQGAPKRRRGNDEEEEDPTTQESDDDDEGLTHEEMCERKRKRDAKRKLEKEERRLNEMVSGAVGGHPAPKAATALARALHEWFRMMMGVSRKSKVNEDSDLPDAPTEEQRQAWMDRNQSRENAIRQAIEKATRNYVAKKTRKEPKFKPNQSQLRMIEKEATDDVLSTQPMRPVKFTTALSSTGRSKYAYLWGSKCEGALALAGFPRCTLDWEAAYDSPWNASMIAILIQEWVKCYDGHGCRAFGILPAENVPEDREQIVKRWFENQRAKYRSQVRRNAMVQTAAGKKIVEDNQAMAKKRETQRRAVSKIHNARLGLIEKLFGKGSPEALLLSHREVHSEDEVVIENNGGTRLKIRKQWRAGTLDTLLELCDKCLVAQEVLPKNVRKAKALVDRGAYSAEADSQSCPPKKFQKSLVSSTWMAETQNITVYNLALSDQNTVNIDEVLKAMRKMLAKGGLDGTASAARSAAVDETDVQMTGPSGSTSTATAGPSGSTSTATAGPSNSGPSA